MEKINEYKKLIDSNRFIMTQVINGDKKIKDIDKNIFPSLFEIYPNIINVEDKKIVSLFIVKYMSELFGADDTAINNVKKVINNVRK